MIAAILGLLAGRLLAQSFIAHREERRAAEAAQIYAPLLAQWYGLTPKTTIPELTIEELAMQEVEEYLGANDEPKETVNERE